MQNEVEGSQLIAYDMEKLQHFNPSITDANMPWLYVFYIERGEFKSKMVKCKGELWLGDFRAEDEGVVKRVRRSWNGLVSYLMGKSRY